MKIALGAVMHESNTFTPGRTTLDNFRNTQYLFGDDFLMAHRGTRSEVGGMLDELGKQGINVLPTLGALALPSPTVARATYDQIKRDLMSQLKDQLDGLDGVLLALHGSMTVEDLDDPEGDLLEDIRRKITAQGVERLACSLDHHGNITEKMMSSMDLAVGYRTHPHVDQYKVGQMTARHLVDLIKTPYTIRRSFLKLPMMTPAENRSEPIHALRAELEAIDRHTNVVTSSFFVGYPWADTSVQGASVMVYTKDDQPAADKLARQLSDKMWILRDQFRFPMHTPDEAVHIGNEHGGGPYILNELADCTLGGASGDVVSTARYLYENSIANSIVVGVVDPEAAATATQAGVGRTVRVAIGGNICQKNNPPLDFEGVVRTLNRDVSGHTEIHAGYETAVGQIAVVSGRGVQIVLIERAGKFGGPTFLEELGIDPQKKKFIVVKEGLNPLETYKDVAEKILMVDSPGFDPQIAVPEDYTRIPRPMYPLDPDVVWSPR